jgi:hypothetical protein
MDPSISGLLGVAIGALISLLTNWLTNQEQQKQWLRAQKAEQEKWLRDKLHEIYNNCIQYSSGSPAVYPGGAGVQKGSIPDVDYANLIIEYLKQENQYKLEKQKWLDLLTIYHPDRGSPAFEDYLVTLRDGKLGRSDIIELAARDPRVQLDIGRTVNRQS